MTAEKYDVFISYSSKDKEWVRGELLQRIEKAGLRAFIDNRDFAGGAPSIEEMERGVSQCRQTLLILTPDYVESDWCRLENQMSLTLDPANQNRRRIALLRAPCEKPLNIATLNHIDFTDGADFGLAWRQLLTALGKPPEPLQPVQPSREQWNLAHPYAMPPNFTGRVAERKMLTDWLNGGDAHPLFTLRALGGFGKSALTWHWLLHDVDPVEWPRVVWWSFYEGDASFERFVTETVCYLDSSSAPSASPREQLVSLLRALHSRGTLLILDGFERALRAFGGLSAAYQGDETVSTEGGARDCILPLADAFLRHMASLPGMHGKVLITTRLRPAPLETRGGMLLQGCCEEELVQLQPADAVEFFCTQGIRGGRVEIEAACEPYGYHPLSLRLLAGLIVGDLRQPGDIAAAQRLDVSGDLVQRQHHVLDEAYSSLRLARQKLLSRIACFRSPVSYDALKALTESESPAQPAVVRGGGQRAIGSLDADLRDLIARGLLHRDLGTNRFDLHPIVRRYAYDRLGEPERAGAHARLRDYFAAVPEEDEVRSLDDLAPVIELYHHTVRSGQYYEACDLFYERLDDVTYYRLGAYQLRIDLLRALFPDGEDYPPRVRDEADQAWTLTALANSYVLSGQPDRAVPLFERQIAIRELRSEKKNVAVGLVNLAVQQLFAGSLRTAEGNFRRSRTLCHEVKSEFQEAVCCRELGRLLAFRGDWEESIRVHQEGFELARKIDNRDMEGMIHAYSAHRALLMLLPQVAVTEAQVARQMAEIGKLPREILRGEWLLGAAHRVAREFDEAESHLNDALERCRRINAVDTEADILIDLARLRRATGATEEAQHLAEGALLITERCGYVLQGADAHLVLAQLAKDRRDLKELHHHATEALRLATCDGPPDYTYKAAYDEATALLR